MITVSFDSERRLVRAQMSGFLMPEDVAGFNAARERAVMAMDLRSGEFSLLVDTLGCVIQSQEVVADFMKVIMTTRLKSRRIAVVRHDSLTRMQTRRILSVRDDTAMFESVADAESWLFDESAEDARSIAV